MINNYLERQIKENFPYQPTFEQEIAVKSLSEFLLSTLADEVFILRGYAGTGKTSLVGALVKTMDQLQQKAVLLAPTGRAAKVFSSYAGHPAFTIHKKIYRQQSFSNETSNFSINDNLATNTLFIVDEASMISNEGLSGSMFGTGRLLDDLNGDGTYDYIVRTPETNVDPGMPGDTTGKTYKISAYLSDGTYLWTYDMGPGIEPGIWYSPFIVYDFNGDGKAEVAIKTAGTDYVKNEKGRVCGGSEYLSVLDGMTGQEIDRVDWPERNDRYGNLIRQNRNQMGVAYLDGKTPFILAARGTYKLMVVDAWMLKNGKLERAWRWDGDEENPVVRSMGAHSMVTADVDGDGRDEVMLGSCMLDDNGTLLWSSGLGHSDKAYLCKLHPDREGMQVFMVSEPKKEDGRGVSVVDAATGKLIWSIGHTTYHVGDGMVTDFDPAHPGLECFASEDRKGGSTDRYLLTADGKKLQVAQDEIPGCRNWIWWDADLLRETFKGDDNRWGAGSSSGGRSQSIWKWKGEILTENIKGDILLMADMEGDWREELITALPGELRIYRTDIPATDRRVTLMQDALYRSYVAHRSMGYPQAPVPSYYLGDN